MDTPYDIIGWSVESFHHIIHEKTDIYINQYFDSSQLKTLGHLWDVGLRMTCTLINYLWGDDKRMNVGYLHLLRPTAVKS